MLTIEPIGKIRAPFKTIEGMPIQPKGAESVKGVVELLPELKHGLKDLDGFSHIYLIYVFHKATRTELEVIPFMDSVSRGVYATRSPLRPNHIGISIVQVEKVEGNKIYVKGIDVLDDTPLLDIKPYIQNFDEVTQSQSGWMNADQHSVKVKRSDERFS